MNGQQGKSNAAETGLKKKGSSRGLILGSLAVGLFLLCAVVGTAGWYFQDLVKVMIDEMRTNPAINPQSDGPPDERIQRQSNKGQVPGAPAPAPPP